MPGAGDGGDVDGGGAALPADGAAHVVGGKVEGEGARVEDVAARELGDVVGGGALGPGGPEALDVDVAHGHVEDAALVAVLALAQRDADLAAGGALPGDLDGHGWDTAVFNTGGARIR